MQVVIEDSAYKRCDKRKKFQEVHLKTTTNYTYDPNLFSLLKLPPDILARQITLYDSKRLKGVCPKELRSRGWEKKEAEKLKLCPNIYKFTTQFNQVSYWVAWEILQEKTARLRADKIAYFVKVAKCLEELKNFHSLVALVMGMNLNAIFRLHDTWEVVSKKDKSSFKSYVELSTNNWKKLKDLFVDLPPPAIPHLGAFLQQLTGTFSHPKLSAQQREDKVTEIVSTIHRFQNSEYDIQNIQHVQDFLSSEKYIMEMQRFLEDNILKMSFEREPINQSKDIVPGKTKTSKSLEDITLVVNPLHCDLDRSLACKPTFKPGHRKTNSLSVLEGFNSDQEKAGTALLLDAQSPLTNQSFQLPDQNLIDDSWAPAELQRNRSVSEPPSSHSIHNGTLKFDSLSRINEIRIQGVLLKKTCQRLGRHPKIRRWKPYYCVVSDGSLSLYMVKEHRSSSSIGQSSVLRKCIELSRCTVTRSCDPKHDNAFTVADSIGNIYKFKMKEGQIRGAIKEDERVNEWVYKICEEKKHRRDLMTL